MCYVGVLIITYKIDVHNSPVNLHKVPETQIYLVCLLIYDPHI